MIHFIIFIVARVGLCVCFYQAGRINAIYKMQTISIELICIMHHNILNWLYDEAKGLSLTDGQIKNIGEFVTLSAMNRIDDVPDISKVNDTFKQCEQHMKERLEKPAND